MKLRTPEQNIGYVFECLGMPPQQEAANGSAEYLSYIGFALNRLSIAKRFSSDGKNDTALTILDDIKDHYAILQSQFSNEYMVDEIMVDEMIGKKPIFRTLVGEPVDLPALTKRALYELKRGINELEMSLGQNINKANEEEGTRRVIYI